MNLSELGLRYRNVIFLMLFLAIAFGLWSYFNLPAREDPKILLREAVITTDYPALAAEEVEEQITKPLENSIRSLEEIKHLRSTSMRGRSVIHVSIEDRYFDLDQIWDKLRERMREAEPHLPAGVSGPSLNTDFGDVSVVTLALQGKDFSPAEQLQMAEHVRTAFYGIEGTAQVKLMGVRPERIYLELPADRTNQMGLVPTELARILSERNILPAAAVMESGEQRFAIQVSGEYRSLDAIRDTEIELPAGGTIRLGDLAEIRRGYQEVVRNVAYFNGEPALVIAVSMLDNASVLEYGKQARALVEQLRIQLPAGYRLELMTFQADQVANAVYGVTASVLQTLGIVLAVVVLFLGLRTGLIVGSIIPAVMLVTLAIMGLVGLDLQRMSLATLVIALGLLVDNAIVMAEDFKTRLAQGSRRLDALREGCRELAIPLLTSTLTTILVFLPLMLAVHVAGEFTRSISIVIAISLMTSWLLSLTVTPILCYFFLPAPKAAADDSASGIAARPALLSDRIFQWMARRYESLLRGILAFRALFLLLVGLALAGGVLLMQHIPQKFFPDSDRNQVLVYLDLPSDVAPSRNQLWMADLSKALLSADTMDGKIESVAAYAGFGGPRFVLSLTPIDPAPNKAFVVINVADRDQLTAVQQATRELIAQQFPQMSAQVTRMFLGPSDSTLLKIQIKGPDRNVLFNTGEQVQRMLSAMPDNLDARHSWEARIPSVKIEVDQARALAAGVTSEDVANSLRGGINGYRLTDFYEDDKAIPLILRYQQADRTNLDLLRSMTVYPAGGTGTGISLDQVADVRIGNGFYRIDHEDLVRTVTIEARNQDMSAEDLAKRVAPALDEISASLPMGHWIEFDGVVTQSVESRAALTAFLPLCLCIILVLLVAQFNSFRRPLLIIATIPLIITGVALGLFMMRANFGFMVLLGIYSLSGIIINNAIVLIERIDIERQDPELDLNQAIIRACVRRLRPILMAATTTVLGFLPLITGQDALFYGMASAMAFGLALGTVMSLGVVPVLYSLFCRKPPAAGLSSGTASQQKDETLATVR